MTVQGTNDLFLWNILMPAVAKNKERRSVLSKALAKRGWEFVEYYLGPTVHEAKITIRTSASHYWQVSAKVPKTTPREKCDDALRKALVREIGRFKVPTKEGVA